MFGWQRRRDQSSEFRRRCHRSARRRRSSRPHSTCLPPSDTARAFDLAPQVQGLVVHTRRAERRFTNAGSRVLGRVEFSRCDAQSRNLCLAVVSPKIIG